MPNEKLKKIIHLASKTIDEPQEYVDSYVAFIDILAFKTIIRDKTAQEVKEIYNEIRMVDTLFCGTNLLSSIPQEVRDNLKMTFMSDSIIISISKDISMAFFGLLVFCLLIQHKLMGLRTPILSRGAISSGNYYQFYDKETDTPVIFGPCFNEAYLLQEEIAIYPRIIIRNTLLDVEKSHLSGDRLALLNNFTRKSDDAYYFIDYLKFRMVFSKEGFEGNYRIKEFIESQLLIQQIERIKQKYSWLREYYNNTLKTSSDITGRVLLDEYKIK